MKVQYEWDGHPRLINFNVNQSPSGFLCTIKTSKDEEKIKEILHFSGNPYIIEQKLKSHISEIIGLPLAYDRTYEGDGYNLRIRVDLLIKQLG